MYVQTSTGDVERKGQGERGGHCCAYACALYPLSRENVYKGKEGRGGCNVLVQEARLRALEELDFTHQDAMINSQRRLRRLSK